MGQEEMAGDPFYSKLENTTELDSRMKGVKFHFYTVVYCCLANPTKPVVRVIFLSSTAALYWLN